MRLETIVRAALRDMHNGKVKPHCGNPPYRLVERIASKHDYDVLDDIQWTAEYAEPGYDTPARGILFADWNQYPSRLTDILERAGYTIEWSDEWSTCEDCGKAVRTSPDSYGWTRSYVLMGECSIVCHECVDHEEHINENLLNNPHAADTLGIDLTEYGFKKFNGTFENGWHPGQDDNPHEIVKRLPAGHDYVFQIADVGQFDVRFTCWIRPQETEV